MGICCLQFIQPISTSLWLYFKYAQNPPQATVTSDKSLLRHCLLLSWAAYHPLYLQQPARHLYNRNHITLRHEIPPNLLPFIRRAKFKSILCLLECFSFRSSPYPLLLATQLCAALGTLHAGSHLRASAPPVLSSLNWPPLREHRHTITSISSLLTCHCI